MELDWKDRLKGFMESNPDLPEGTEPEPSVETPKKLGDLKVTLERKGRGGKTATIIHGFTCDDSTLLEIASRLKRQLGTGGSARGGEILIQGDRREEVLAFIKNLKA